MLAIAGGVFAVIFAVVLSVFCAAAKAQPALPGLPEGALPDVDSFTTKENSESEADDLNEMISARPQNDLA